MWHFAHRDLKRNAMISCHFWAGIGWIKSAHLNVPANRHNWFFSIQSPFPQYGQNQDIFIRQKVWLPANPPPKKNKQEFLKIEGTKTCYTNSWNCWNCREGLDWSKQNCRGAPLAYSIPIWKGVAQWEDMKGIPIENPDTNKAAHGHVLPFTAFYPMDILGYTCLLATLQVSTTRYGSAYQCLHLKRPEIKIKKFFSLMRVWTRLAWTRKKMFL